MKDKDTKSLIFEKTLCWNYFLRKVFFQNRTHVILELFGLKMKKKRTKVTKVSRTPFEARSF